MKPTLLLDTRAGIGTSGRTSPVRGGTTVRVTVAGTAEVPLDAAAVWVGVSSRSTAAFSRLAVGPAGVVTGPPLLRAPPLPDRSVTLVVPVGARGQIAVRPTARSSHLTVTVLGYLPAG